MRFGPSALRPGRSHLNYMSFQTLVYNEIGIFRFLLRFDLQLVNRMRGVIS